MYSSLGILVIAAIVAGVVGGWFTRSLWIWLALVLLFGIMVATYYLGTRHFKRATQGRRTAVLHREPPAAADRPRSAGRISDTGRQGSAVGPQRYRLRGIAVIAFLLMFKPF